MCLCFGQLLTKRSEITRTMCIRDAMGVWVNAEHFQTVILAALLAVPCTVVRCVVRTVGTVLFVIKVCTVHVGHCPPVSCMYEHV